MKMRLKEKMLRLNIVIDNEYLDKYVELINKNKHTKNEKNKTQKHHIIPRCYYKNFGLDVDNSCDNIVNLIYSDHIKAHYYLALCGCGDYYIYCFINAFAYMVGNSYKYSINIGDINELDEDTINTLYNECSIRKSIYQKGQGKGCKKSEETRKKMSKAQSGLVVINNGTSMKHIKRCDVDSFVSNGWNIGGLSKSEETKQKISNSNKGKIVSEETRLKISKSLTGHESKCKGVKTGRKSSTSFKKGHIPWNVGVSPSEETKSKISEKLKGRKPTTLNRISIYRISDDVQKFINVEDLDKYIRDGFIVGKRPVTNETRQKLSEKAKEREKEKRKVKNEKQQ